MKVLFFALLLGFTPVFASRLLISEESLMKEVQKSPPSIKEIELSLHGVKVKKLQYEEGFQTSLSGDASYLKTREDQFSTFIPVNTPTHSYGLSLNKMTKAGLSLAVKGSVNQFTNNFVNKATTSSIGAGLTLDLYKDFLGRSTEKNLNLLDTEYLQTLIENEIQKRSFQNSIRNIYWQLVANAEKARITKEQLAASEKQVKQAKRRLRNGIADKGEVAKYQSQLSIRKSQIILYDYEKSNLVQSLKELLPQFQGKTIELDQYSLPQAITTVLACSNKISSYLTPPLKYTKHDEIVDLLKKREKEEISLNNDYSKADVKLSSEVNVIGKGIDSTSNSYDNLEEENNLSYSVALNFTVPLDDRKDQTEDILKKVARKKYIAQREKSLARIGAFHSETLTKIRMLQQILANQNQNISYLGDSLKVTQKKFNQARIDVQQLVSEQEAYLQSFVDEIDTKLLVVTTLIDYLSVYNQFPCHLNRF